MKPTILLLSLATVVHGKTLKVEAGVHDRIQTIVALNERWTVEIYAVSDAENPYNLIEPLSEQQMAGDDDLKLPEYHGIREWDGAENATFLTSEGITNRDEANAITTFLGLAPMILETSV